MLGRLQGEMVQAKFGIPAVAQRQLEIYTTAVLLARQSTPQPPRLPIWRSIMDELAEISCADYRSVGPVLDACLLLADHLCSYADGPV